MPSATAARSPGPLLGVAVAALALACGGTDRAVRGTGDVPAVLSASPPAAVPDPAATGDTPLPGAPVAVSPIAVFPCTGSWCQPGSSWDSGYLSSARVVIRDARAWEAAWQVIRAHGVSPPAAPAPAIDFSRQMVLVAALGQRSSGGYSVAIPAVTADGDVFHAAVVETRPGRGCAVTANLTSPVAAVAIPRSDAAVRFEDRVVVHDCGG